MELCLSPIISLLIVHRCWRTIRTGFDYYEQDQTRDPRTCCADLFCVFIRFVGCLTNRRRLCGVFQQKKGFKSKLKAWSLKLKGKVKYNALKIKVVWQILYIHSWWLFSLALVLRVFLEFCLGDLWPVLPMENSYLYKENNLERN
jgi:hypothetical protein